MYSAIVDAFRKSVSRVEAAERKNVGAEERLFSIVGGAAALGYGLGRRTTFGGMLIAVVGGFLLYRGIGGYCPVYGALGIDTARGKEEPAPASRPQPPSTSREEGAPSPEESRDAKVQEASEESFPASDAPAWGSTTIS